ncbi:hydrogenase 4 subunit F [Oxyplasma meridianum]|uniref:Hydrogenase 4 subunit F n=1 Tax=Oxyplasma meridianum TaxID=3073602 RepID=A0AAX4NJE7_9ARCH
MDPVPLIIVILPGLANIFYRVNIKLAGFVSASLTVALSLFLYTQLPLKNLFYIDRLTWVFIVMVASIYLLSTLYSWEYVRSIRNRGISENNYYLLLNFFTAAMFFSLVMNNYGFMWVGIEATTISSALLLITEKTDVSLEATWRYIILVSAGVTFAFISVIMIYYHFGTLDVYTILHSGGAASVVIKIAVAVALVGFGTKVGVFPVHTWLPDAHSEAPSPVSAMFSGVLLPVALYVLYRIYEISPFPQLYTWFAVISIAAASLFLAYQRKYKRMFAYSTMENMNLALFGFALGGAGVIGALLLLVSHSFGKAGAFYSSGNILKSSEKRNIAQINGIWKGMPYTSSSLLLSSLAVTGTPPFGTFVGEFIILYAAVETHAFLQFGIVLFFLMAAFISVNYNVTGMIFRGSSDLKESGKAMPVISLITSIIPLIIGVVIIGGFFNALV